ncbi:MAG: hypothetical protein ACKVJC_02760 [Flavobacteriales bacterium]
MEALKHAHSGLRWIALILLLVAIVNAAKSQNSGNYMKKDKMINLFAMIFLHIQLLIGLGLYFSSSKVNFIEGWMSEEILRFYGMEHLIGMLLAIIIVSKGRSNAEKKMKGSRNKHRKILKTYLIALILILAFIPWPFRGLGAGWM